MNILITGSAGFIGFSLCSELLKSKKIKITGIDNLNLYYSKKLKLKRNSILKKKKNYNFIKIDITKKKNLDKLKKFNFDLIVHLAAQAGIRYSLEKPEEYVYSNQLGFFNILNFANTKKIKLIYASSSSVYGDQNKYPLKENSPHQPINLYSATKLGNEIFAEIYSNLHNLNSIGIRFFTVFGEWGRPDMFILKYLYSKFKNQEFEYFNEGNHYRDFTYIGDVVKILKKIILKKKFRKKHEVFNLCSSKPVKISTIFDFLEKNKKHQKVKRYKKSKLDVYKTHGSNTKVINYTKFKKFTNFKVALNKTIKWFDENKELF